ncbi:MAG: protein kinase [Actinomycetaceae bacterium]|nr:protein kinase [Actinomycetaceae bacterium]
MSIAGYELIQPFATTSTGTMWLARGRDGASTLIRFLSREQAEQLSGRLSVLSSISSPYLAGVQDVVPDDGRVAIVTEMVEGTVLSQWMHIPGALAENRVLAVLREIALGLKELHDRQIAHGDLSTSNVIVGEDGAVLIDHVTGAGVTMPYAAPEVVAELESGYVPVDRRPGDVWAWGKIAQELGCTCTAVQRALDPNPASRASIDEVLADPQLASTDSSAAIPMEADVSMLSAGALLRIEAAREQTILSEGNGKRPRGRHVRKSNRSWLRVGVATLMVVAGAVALAGWWVRPVTQQPSEPVRAEPATTVKCPSSGEAITIVNDLTTRRNAAIMEADPDLLPAVIGADSEVLDKDIELIEAMAESQVSVTGLSTLVDEVRVMECAPLTIDATFTQAPHERCVAGQCAEVPQQPSVRVRLIFEGPPWRVTDVISLEPDEL